MRAAAAVLALLAALALAGCTTTPPAGPGEGFAGNATAPPLPPGSTVDLAKRFAHEHATFALFIAGERVSFNHTDYDLQAVRVVRAHLHVQQPDGEHVIHVEDNFPGGVPDVTLAQFLGFHGLRFGPGALTLDTRDGHNGTAWPDQGEQRWRVRVAERNGTFADVADGPGHVLREGQRVLLAYGALGEAEMQAQERAVPEPPAPPRRP